MKKYDIAVFDVDGTLLDTTEGVLAAVIYTIKKYNLPTLSEEQLKTFIGPPVQDSFQKYYQLGNRENQKLAECFRDRYKTFDLLKAVPYSGIFKTMDILYQNNIKIAVATYKRQDYAIKLLKHFGFDKYTNVMYGADNFNKLKKKVIIIKCMEDLGVTDYTRAVMIGDTDNDAIGADKIGMNFLGVIYGFGFKNPNDVKQYPSIGSVDNAEDISAYFV